jgi:RimJ/RimL family protein N-acetyltransferase
VSIFETERLIVRPWTDSDADVARLYDIYSRWEVSRWLGNPPAVMASPDEAAPRIERWNTFGANLGGRRGIWAIQRRDTGVVAGSVLLVPLADADGTRGAEHEVGWHLHPDSWGNGFATEAARGAIDMGFADGLEEIYAVVYPDNAPSLRVCQRLGMTPLGRTDRWYGVELEAFRLTS